MLHWGKVSFTDGLSLFMEGAIQFNDYVMSLSMFIFWFVVVLVVLELAPSALGGDRDVEGVFVLEFVWTLLPLMLLVFMAYPSMMLLYVGDVLPNYSVGVLVEAHQWYWSYSGLSGEVDSYMVEEGGYRLVEVDNRLIIPCFETVGIGLTSSDVIHSWAVPAFGVKVDCIPGRLNFIVMEILVPGVYYGQCSELCGVLHSFMPIVVEAVELKEYLS